MHTPDVPSAPDGGYQHLKSLPSVTGAITYEAKAKALAICEIAGGDLCRLIQLYGDVYYSFSGDGVKTFLADQLREQLSKLAADLESSGRGFKYGHILDALLQLEQDEINNDGCVTTVLYAACRDFDTVMKLWERFSSDNMRADVHPQSEKFLQKHLETYGDDEKGLRTLHKKFRYGSRRAAFIDKYINDLRYKRLSAEQMPGLQAAKGDYDKLIEFRKACDDFVLDDEFSTAIDEVLPEMLEGCGGDFEKLIQLYKKPYCGRPQVKEAVKQALTSAVEQCGADIAKLAKLLEKIPEGCRSDFDDIIYEAAITVCKADKQKFAEVVKSPLAKLLPKTIVLNLDSLADFVDIELLKSLLALKKHLREDLNELLDKGIQKFTAELAEVHKTDFDQLLVLAKTVGESPTVRKAISEALRFSVQQYNGDLVKLCEVYEKMPETWHRDVISAVRQVTEDCSLDLLITQAGNDLAGLQKLCDKMPYHFREAVKPLVDRAVRKIAESKAEECAGDLQKLLELYKGIPPTIEFHHGGGEDCTSTHHFNIDDEAKSVVLVYLEKPLMDLISQYGEDLKKLGDLYEKLRYELQRHSGRRIVNAVKSIVKSSVRQHRGAMDAFAEIFENVGISLGLAVIEGDDELLEYARELFSAEIEKCGGDIDALWEVKRKAPSVFHVIFEDKFKSALQSIVSKCNGDFEKLAKLYSMVPADCQEFMHSSLKVA